MNLNTILNQFRKSFPQEWLNSLAKRTNLIQRSTSKFNGRDMCILLIQAVNAPREISLNGFAQILYRINKNAKLKAQSLWERIVNNQAIAFMKEIYAETWTLYVKHVKDECDKNTKFFENFSQILIEDSTVVTLHEKLSKFFQGSGGKSSKSSLKLHLIFNAISNKLALLEIYRDKKPDNTLAYDVLQMITEGSLVIRDLGFFVLEVFKKIDEKRAYYLSRLHPSVNVYLKINDPKPIDFVKYIKTKFKHFSCGSLEVFLGAEERLPVRLIFYKTPEHIVNERKRKVKRKRLTKGGMPSAKLLTFQEYTFFITNMSEELAPTKFVGTLYRLRWDIEQIFKTWKSHLRLDVLKGTRPERIEVFLYAKLVGILLLGIVCDYLKGRELRFRKNAEVSEKKVAEFMLSTNIFAYLFGSCISKQIIEFLEEDYWITSFFKQKRGRKTTLERINNLEAFGEVIC
jgi:Transposase DDE domain